MRKKIRNDMHRHLSGTILSHTELSCAATSEPFDELTDIVSTTLRSIQIELAICMLHLLHAGRSALSILFPSDDPLVCFT